MSVLFSGRRSLICVLACLTFVVSCYSAQDVSLPRSVRTCKRDTPDYTSCLRLAIQESWLTFMKGIPELGLPTLDPYTVNHLEQNYENGEIKGKIVVNDLKVYGLAKTHIMAVRPRHEENRFSLDMDLEIPKSLIDGDYLMEGSVGPYKVGGQGYFNVSMEGVIATWGLDGRVENDRWVIEHFRIEQDVQKFKIYVDDLFNGNVELTRAIVRFINENWVIFYKAMAPTIIEFMDQETATFLNEKIFSQISFSKLFP